MLNYLQRLQNNYEEGFTLTELIVVIVIIGILAAIAVPMYLNNRKQAIDAQTVSNVDNIAKSIEQQYYENYDAEMLAGFNNMVDPDAENPFDSKINDGTKFAIGVGGKGYCIVAWNEAGSKHTDLQTGMIFDSSQGGMNATLTPDCMDSIQAGTGGGGNPPPFVIEACSPANLERNYRTTVGLSNGKSLELSLWHLNGPKALEITVKVKGIDSVTNNFTDVDLRWGIDDDPNDYNSSMTLKHGNSNSDMAVFNMWEDRFAKPIITGGFKGTIFVTDTSGNVTKENFDIKVPAAFKNDPSYCVDRTTTAD